MDYTTQLQELSTQLQCALSSINLPELIAAQTEALSGLNTLANSLSVLDTVISELTSVPVHPYDALLYEHFKTDHVFKTIDDIPDPGEEMPYNECLNFLRQKGDQLNKTMFHNLTCKPEQQTTSYFQTLSCNGIVQDKEKEKNYLEYFEMLRRIPINSVTPETYEVISRKLMSEFIKVI